MTARAPLVLASGRTQQLQSGDAITGSGTVPSGGTTGQVLAKASNTDYDLGWVAASGGGSAVVGLIDGATINTDASLGSATAATIFSVTLGGNRTIANPTSPSDGQRIQYRLVQDGTGGRTVTWGAKFAFTAGVATPILSTGAGATDYVLFVYNSTLDIWLCLSSSTLPESTNTGVGAGTYKAPQITVNAEGRITAAADLTMVVAITDAATINTDASVGAGVAATTTYTVTLGGNRTMANPTNATSGQKIIYRLTQDGTGSRTISWGADFRFSADLPVPTLTTTASKTDYIMFIYNAADSKWDCLAINKGF